MHASKKVKEFSIGVIPLKKGKGQWSVLLVQHRKGHWAFPKGHPEPLETFKETAERELKEETGLKIRSWLPLLPLEECYSYRKGEELIEKKVVYFLAEVGGSLQLQGSEVSAARWLEAAEAEKLATFSQTQKLCLEVKKIILHSGVL